MSSKLSISAASRRVKKGRETLRNMMDNGELSFELNKKGNRVIDLSELQRVFPEQMVLAEKSKPKANQSTTDMKLVDQVLESAKREREQLENHIARIEKDFDDAKSYFEKSLNLLEDKRDKAEEGSGWQAAIEQLNERIANQEQRHATEVAEKMKQLEDRHKAEAAAKLKELEQRYKKKLDAERNKSLFQKLFG